MLQATYGISEIFYSLQGEGAWTGTPMIFVRFAGCNLSCAFCDTDHSLVEEMTVDEILGRTAEWKCVRICLTGGEPSLQAGRPFLDAMKKAGYSIHMETNGTIACSYEFREEGLIDWLTVSPKSHIDVPRADEIKIVYPTGVDPDMFVGNYGAIYVQPLDDPNREKNLGRAMEYVLSGAGRWRLGLQTHKLTGAR